MWYLIQIVIACTAAYIWCTVPGNSPENLGKGLFLGWLIAWYVTSVTIALRDAYKQGIRRKQRTPVEDKSLRLIGDQRPKRR